MAKVEAPNRDYNGPGPGGAVFTDGVADVSDDAALNYYRSAGYTVSGKVQNPVKAPEIPDPREVSDVVIGTRLRDAAVDPRPGDFLPPVNAGEANPHGPEVVSPEIHASGPAGIRPGEVFVEDLAKQEDRESAFAEVRLVDQEPVGSSAVTEVVGVDLDDRGELDLSDPGSADVGRREASDSGAADGEAPGMAGEPVLPKESDNKPAWVDYAVFKGAEREQAEAMTKAQLVEKYS